MLKLGSIQRIGINSHPAAFGRLRVETATKSGTFEPLGPAAFGRLRVETFGKSAVFKPLFPAAFGRLRVETDMLTR